MPLASDIISNKVPRAEQQLPGGVRQRARVQPPNLHHSCPHAMPSDGTMSGLLPAQRAEVAFMLLSAALTAMLLPRIIIFDGGKLPLVELAFVCL